MEKNTLMLNANGWDSERVIGSNETVDIRTIPKWVLDALSEGKLLEVLANHQGPLLRERSMK